jgi:hypothetical protein
MSFIKRLYGWTVRKLVTLTENWSELNSHDPWRNSSMGDLRADSPNGIRLFDLATIHLQDHGYYVRLYRNGNLMVVFNSWIKYKTHSRPGAIGFEVGWNSVYEASEKELIWCFGFKTYESLHAGDHGTGPPRIIGNVHDPFCLDRILLKTREHFRGLRKDPN